MGDFMNTLTIYKDDYADATVISNSFIDDYMADANDAQLKIYLYLIRQISANIGTSVSEIADKFNHTEKDVLRSLRYWEKKGLLSLEFDENKNLAGIRLCNPSLRSSKNEVTAVPAVIVPVSTKDNFVALTPNVTVSQKTPLLTEDAETLPESESFEKPAYTLDEIKTFKNRESTSQLLFIAEQYLNKVLSSNDIRSILFLSDCLGFSDDLIDYLLQYCVDRDKKDFRYIEKVAISWAQSNITTPKQAEAFTHKYDKTVYSVMNALGKSNTPTIKEVDFIKRWNNEFSFSADIILEACERTVMATDKHRFEYADKILTNWKNAGIRHKADIQKMDSTYQKTNKGKLSSSNKFNHFKQNDYDFDALEKELLSN